MKIKLFLTALLIWTFTQSYSQIPGATPFQTGNEGTLISYNVSYGAQLPAGDLADRFGFNYNLGNNVDLILASNWIIGLDAQFIFGTDVKENPLLNNVIGPEGFIYSNSFTPADIVLRERGFYFGAKAGRLFALSKNNKRMGIRATFGAGLLQHKIRIQDDPQVFVPQLDDTYKKGYDRLTNGLALEQFIGFQYLGILRRVNFYAGFEIMEGFTMNRRSFNFDTQMPDTTSRLDILYGFRLGWTLPFYVGENSEEIYY